MDSIYKLKAAQPDCPKNHESCHLTAFLFANHTPQTTSTMAASVFHENAWALSPSSKALHNTPATGMRQLYMPTALKGYSRSNSPHTV